MANMRDKNVAGVGGGGGEAYELECPVCKTTKYRNPQMKLMVNVCGHALCDNCVKMIFIKESGQCPECDLVLKRHKFRLQIFEDPNVEKEIDIRRRVMRIYNKLEEDFEQCSEYDDYLEMIEQLVYNLTNDLNKAECERQLDTYERHNRDDIKKNWSRRSAEEEELDRVLEAEKLAATQRQQLQRTELSRLNSNTRTQRNNTTLLQDLMASDGDASQIVRSHAERLKQEEKQHQQEQQQHQQNDLSAEHAMQLIDGGVVGAVVVGSGNGSSGVANTSNNLKEFSSGVRIGAGGFRAGAASGGAAAATAAMLKAAQYEYEPPLLPPSLPLPGWAQLRPDGYLAHVRAAPASARAGGYTEHYAAMRALTELMAGHILK